LARTPEDIKPILKELTRIVLSARERVMIFIDGSNLFHACKSVGGFKITW